MYSQGLYIIIIRLGGQSICKIFLRLFIFNTERNLFYIYRWVNSGCFIHVKLNKLCEVSKCQYDFFLICRNKYMYYSTSFYVEMRTCIVNDKKAGWQWLYFWTISISIRRRALCEDIEKYLNLRTYFWGELYFIK